MSGDPGESHDDLRRLLERTTDLGRLSIDDVMTRSPRSIRDDALAVDALRMMEDHRVMQLPVIDVAGRLAGALHLHDLFRARVV